MKRTTSSRFKAASHHSGLNEQGGNILSPRVSVLVLNYNGIKYLDDCFKSLEKLSYPNYEVVLIDNASNDGSVAYVQNNFPWVKVVIHQNNYGFCEGYNRSVEHAEGEYLAFLNNDTAVDANWLKELITASHEHQADICGSKILFYNEPQIINHLGAKITTIGSGYDLGFGMTDKDSTSSQAPVPVAAACGAAMLIKKETFLKLGGFDPDYFAYFEDLDLCWRAWLQGYRVMLVPGSVIYHKFGGSWGSSRHSKLRTFYGQRNRLTNIVKNFEFINVIKGLSISLVYDTALLIRFAITGQFNNVSALVRGTLYFIKELPKTLRKRRKIQGNRVISDKQLYQLGLISPLLECIGESIRLERMTATRSKAENLHRDSQNPDD